MTIAASDGNEVTEESGTVTPNDKGVTWYQGYEIYLKADENDLKATIDLQKKKLELYKKYRYA